MKPIVMSYLTNEPCGRVRIFILLAAHTDLVNNTNVTDRYLDVSWHISNFTSGNISLH